MIDDIWKIILEYLDGKSIIRFRLVCQNFKRIFDKFMKFHHDSNRMYFTLFGIRHGPYLEWYTKKELNEWKKVPKRPLQLVSRFQSSNIIKYKKIQTFYCNGLLHGTYKEWFIAGQLKKEARFNTSKYDGKYFRYRPNGEFDEKGYYKNGKKDGLQRVYTIGGAIREYYENGEKIYRR